MHKQHLKRASFSGTFIAKQAANQNGHNIMKKFLFLIILLFTLGIAFSAGAVSLLRVNKVSKGDTVQLFLLFDELPVHQISSKDKTITIQLQKTVIAESTLFFPTDRVIEEISHTKRDNDSILSFSFKYKPQSYKVSSADNNILVLDILPGNAFTKAYPDLSTTFQGVSIVARKSTDYTNPLIASPYPPNWHSFFLKYESTVTISMPVSFTPVPFPIIALLPPLGEENLSLLPPQIVDLGNKQAWKPMVPLILERLNAETEFDNKKTLALLYGEILARSGDFTNAYKQLYLLNQEYTTEPVGIFAKYLLIGLLAKFKDPFDADFEYRNLEPKMTTSNPLTPYFTMSQIETALATNQLSRMKTLLEKDTIPFPDHLEQLRELRQSDYWYANGNMIKAFVGYKLINDPELLAQHPYSLNGFCDTLYQQKQYRDAVGCYKQLANLARDKDALGLISYREGMAALHVDKNLNLINTFARIEDAFPGTEAGFRAALKKTDLRYLSRSNWEERAIAYYNALARKSTHRQNREEAAFKEALVYFLQGDSPRCIESLTRFLKDFRRGTLQQTALALMIEVLPNELKQLVSEKNYLRALTLAKQNRLLFKKNWIDLTLLVDLAEAYHQLGIYEEASKIYLYLIDIAESDQKGTYFLPLVQTTFDQGNYDLVEDYATQFAYNYAEADDASAIFLLRLQSLLGLDKIDKAITLLPSPLPDSRPLQLLAGRLYFLKNNFKESATIFRSVASDTEPLDDDSQFMLAESLFNLQEYEPAEPAFTLLYNSEEYSDQSLYRLATIAKTQGDEQKALKLYQEIVDKGNTTLWQRLAAKELEFSTESKKFNRDN